MAAQRKEQKSGVKELKTFGNKELQKKIDKKTEAAALKKKEGSVKVVRRDQAHKSNRGNRGGNLGSS